MCFPATALTAVFGRDMLEREFGIWDWCRNAAAKTGGTAFQVKDARTALRPLHPSIQGCQDTGINELKGTRLKA